MNRVALGFALAWCVIGYVIVVGVVKQWKVDDEMRAANDVFLMFILGLTWVVRVCFIAFLPTAPLLYIAWSGLPATPYLLSGNKRVVTGYIEDTMYVEDYLKRERGYIAKIESELKLGV